uniref:Uncharacterized protein n=1 Tax=Anolis carolinensis TaxID=28377 RepID=H9GQB8_ANOCA|nr:PREDICTED: protein cornichon homolog 2 isoform X2 [Anolis carolinensis]|eukprot:XP_016853041.1 PREDICTED: protein cornichon homolog 2 isoform X2 [Anolis carolinensis]
MAFTFAAFCYMLTLVLCASLIFFVIWHIIAFDELHMDFKNPIDQGNPARAVSLYMSCPRCVCLLRQCSFVCLPRPLPVLPSDPQQVYIRNQHQMPVIMSVFLVWGKRQGKWASSVCITRWCSTEIPDPAPLPFLNPIDCHNGHNRCRNYLWCRRARESCRVSLCLPGRKTI